MPVSFCRAPQPLVLPEAIRVQVGTGCALSSGHGGIWQDPSLETSVHRNQTLPHTTRFSESTVPRYHENYFPSQCPYFFPHKWALQFYVDSKGRVTDVLCKCHGTSHTVSFSSFVQKEKTTILPKVSVLTHPFPLHSDWSRRKEEAVPWSKVIKQPKGLRAEKFV